jgi:signal transduction histidine kinase
VVLVVVVGGVVLALTRLHAEVVARPVHPAGYVLVALAGLVLAWRRRWPTPVLIATTALVVPGYTLGAVTGPAMALVAVAAYTVATRNRWPEIVGCGVAVAVAWASAVLTGAGSGRDTVDPFPWVALAVAVGVAVGATRRAAAARAAWVGERSRLRMEQERVRMAQEVHDVVSHSLAVINLQAGVAAHVADRRPEQAAVALREIREASRVALTDLRDTLAVLRGPGGVDAAEGTGGAGLHRVDELVRAAEAAGLAVTVRGDAGALPRPVDAAAFRIVQEAVTNVIRHARGARHVTIELARRDGALQVRVGDDGRAPVRARPRHGVRGIVERSVALGGTACAAPAEQGFLVRAEIPVRPQP